MSGKTHSYTSSLTWTGNLGEGTSSYKAYSRDHVFSGGGKPDLPGSSDPAFRGDARRYNPEDLLVASLSSCHMLWYLHLCAEAGISVLAYRDEAVGTMVEDAARGGYFTRVVLHPKVTIASGGDPAKARQLHHAAHEKCFVANSVNFPVTCEPEIEVGE
ncbi:MAG TPA: OsmC family protein [Gemmatimonadales bacterium]|jgi:organic hydroperoxide reductase OsmC/OhrA|nr:OsmC family protein [Gemmatimonadales bacterium]